MREPTLTSPLSPFAAASSPPPRSRHLLHSLRFAFHGLGYAWQSQRNFRIHTAIAVLAIFLGLVLGLRPLEWAVLVLAMTMVLAAELFNTALEMALDGAIPELHPVVKTTKDLAAAAVLVAAVGALALGVVLFLPRLLALLP